MNLTQHKGLAIRTPVKPILKSAHCYALRQRGWLDVQPETIPRGGALSANQQ
jgi:hypothetical protein